MKILKTSRLKSAPWPWPKTDIKTFAEQALQNIITMPGIGGVIELGKEPAWSVPAGVAANSKRLWLNSLHAVHFLFEMSNQSKLEKYADHAIFLFDSYFNALNRDSELYRIAWGDEHAVANRLSVLVALLHANALGQRKSGISDARLLDLMEVHAGWLMEDKHYVKNNHGVMMDRALLNAAVLVSDLDPETSTTWIKKAVSRLGEMLVRTFDEDGCCTENSPTYHYVNYALFSHINQFLQHHNVHHEQEIYWAKCLRKALMAGHILIRPDGNLPLIGDSMSKLGVWFPFNEGESSEGIGHYPNSGLFVYKIGHKYISLRGGGSTFSHRHRDDSSITVFYKGKDLIVDPGMYNYDISDRMRRWFASPRAHSGFYLDSAGEAQFASYATPQDVGGISKSHVAPDKFEVFAWHSLCREAMITRTMSLLDDVLNIQDKFEAENECQWRQQFHLHPDCTLQIDESSRSAIIQNGDAIILISCLCETAKISVENSHYSEKFMAISDSKVLVFHGQSQGLVLESRIDFM